MDGDGETTLVPLDKVDEIGTVPDQRGGDADRPGSGLAQQRRPTHASLVSKFEQSWVTDDEWDIVEEGDVDRSIKWPPFWLPREGKLTAQE